MMTMDFSESKIVVVLMRPWATSVSRLAERKSTLFTYNRSEVRLHLD